MSLKETIETFRNKPTSSESRPFMVLRPGGNDTALISGVITDPLTRRRMNEIIMAAYPSVEQVGFVELTGRTQLMMAGGEFCGNATRSTAWLAPAGREGELALKVSGVKDSLRAGSKNSNEAFAQIPIYPEFSKIERDTEKNGFIVEMEGITHFVCFETNDIAGMTPDQIKSKSIQDIKDRGLDRFPASGVIYASLNDRGWQITPIVYVRDIDTLFYETACGSGTTALGLVIALNEGRSITNVSVLQPSGMLINVTVRRDAEKFNYAEINGPIVPLLEGTFENNEKITYIIERVFSKEQLEDAISGGGLVELYKKVFSGPPYFESFNDQEVTEYFREYLDQGILFLARNGRQIIGFGASVPLITQDPLVALAKKNGLAVDKNWYMADLGVDPNYRKNGIGKRLVEARIEAIPDGSEILMRTTENNIASKTLYLNLGFRQIPGMFQEVEQARIGGVTMKDRRIFLTKEK